MQHIPIKSYSLTFCSVQAQWPKVLSDCNKLIICTYTHLHPEHYRNLDSLCSSTEQLFTAHSSTTW